MVINKIKVDLWKYHWFKSFKTLILFVNKTAWFR